MTRLGTQSDEALFQLVRERDLEALVVLVKRYETGLFALLVRLAGGDRHLADDLFQETFLRVVRSAETFDRQKMFRPWLTSIAVNLFRDEARRRRLRSEVSLNGEAGEAAPAPLQSPGIDPQALAQESDEAERVQRSLQHLTEKERLVVLLHFFDGMTLAEVAETLEIPIGTVKSRLHGGLTRLKQILGATR